MLKDMYVHVPEIKPRRSVFKFNPKCYTSLNVGELVPLYKPIEVIPGDTFKMRSGSLLEMTPMLSMVYDTLYFDIFSFYVPFRILWENYIHFYGENKKDPFDSIGVYSIPQVIIPTGGYNVGTIANYFGIRPGVGATTKISALPFRAYAKIVNEYFIADYLDSKANVNYNIDSAITGSNGSNYITDLVKGGKPFIANKLHDRFTSALPKPQAGQPVPLPLGQAQLDDLAVSTGEPWPFDKVSGFPYGMGAFFVNPTTGEPIQNGTTGRYGLGITMQNDPTTQNFQGSVSKNQQTGSTETTDGQYFVPNNLHAGGNTSIETTATINDLRNAIIVQHMLEAEMRHGNRYFEQLAGDYGIISDDLTLQRPEYLGGCRFSINVNPVVQNSETNTTPQGTLTSYSITQFSHLDFTKSFKEPGYIIMLGCARYPHSYPQGLDKLWTKKDKYDFYNHHFEGMGEQPIYNREIFFTGTDTDNEVFGYTPYGTEYRDMENIATGEMSPDYSTPLDTFHYADDYQSTPSLSSSWLKEDKANVERTLFQTSQNVSNFRCAFSFNITAYRPLSIYGIPGLKRL